MLDLDLEDQNLEGTSFWDHFTHNSVKMIKSAFMDAMAEKDKSEDDSTPLCNEESVSVKLIIKTHEKTKEANLKGGVHFEDNAPECVCSIH